MGPDSKGGDALYAGLPRLLAEAARVGPDPHSSWMESPPGKSRQGMSRPTALTPAPIRDRNRHRHMADELPEPRASGLGLTGSRPPQGSRKFNPVEAGEQMVREILAEQAREKCQKMGRPGLNLPAPRAKAPPKCTKGLRLTTSERRKVALIVATRKGAACKFGYACKHGSRCRGRHSPDEAALFKTRELRVTDLERTAGCAYCRAGICRFGYSCRGQTVIRAATRRANSCTETVSALVLPPPRVKLRKRGRRRPRGRPHKESKQGRRLERQERREKEDLLGTPRAERVPDSWPPRRTVREDSESSGGEEPTPWENQPGSHQCCSEDPVCRLEARMQFCGLWFCDLHSPNVSAHAGQRVGISATPIQGEVIRASWDRITSWTAESSTWGLDAATSGWTNLQHGQMTRAGAGSFIALLFAIGWVTVAAAAAVATMIVLPALHAAQHQRAQQRDHEARAEAAIRMQALFSTDTDPSESDCLRLIHRWRRGVRLQRPETRRQQMLGWGDSCKQERTEEEMDALISEMAGGGAERYVECSAYQECLDRQLQRAMDASMGDASSDESDY